MAHHASSPLRALYRVFVLPALSNLPIPTRTRLIPATTLLHQPHRSLSCTPIPHAKNRPAESRRQKWDGQITSLRLYLVDPLTNTLSEPRTRYDILNNLDTRTHRLVQLSPDEPSNPDFIPVCKIISKKEAYESEKKKKMQAKEMKKANAKGSEAGMKTLELNWAIDKGDLSHKLGKLKEFLGEGRRVEVCMKGKKRGRKASLEECEVLIAAVREAAQGVEGAKEREMEGKVGGVATVEFLAKGSGGGGGKDISALGRGKEGNDGEEDDDGDGDGEIQRVENR